MYISAFIFQLFLKLKLILNHYIYQVQNPLIRAAMIEIDNSSIQDAIRRIQRQYSNISGPVLHKAISNALNRAATQSRTAANKEIRKTYNISASALNNQMKVRYSQTRTLTARVVASGSPLSLTNFGASQTKGQDTVKFDKKGNLSRVTRKTRKRNPVSGVSFEIKKGNKEILPTAFIQTANGGTTVFARGSYKGSGEGFEFAKERLPIAKMTTISIPLMFANNEVMTPTGRQAEDFFSARIEHEINWLLQR
jgi:hypothetical protein